MKPHRRLRYVAALSLSLFFAPAQMHANEICATVSWDDATNIVTWEVDYNITSNQFASAFQSMDQNTGVLSPNPPFGIVGFASWFDLGDVFCSTYADGNNGAFWDGFNGITSSDPNLGIAPDYDGGGADDLFLVAQSTPLPAGQGSFTLTIPMNSDPALCYNTGTHISNDGMGKITVVPEPSAALLLALAGLCLWATGIRHKQVRLLS